MRARSGVSGPSKWRDGRPVALLFAATIVLPSLALAVLAWRALDADRQLVEQVWRERLQDAARRAHAHLERRAMDARNFAEVLARGEDTPAKAFDGMVSVILAPELKFFPASRFAWIPDGRASAGPPLPKELEQAEIRERQRDGAREAASVYAALLGRTPVAWHGWIYLRLSHILARAGESGRAAAALHEAARIPDSPGPAPTAFAARFELASTAPEEAARLYHDLNAGGWLLKKSPYSFYETRLREWAGARLAPETLAAEQRRQAMSRLLERVNSGESGWMAEGPVSALVVTASHARAAAVITLESQWQAWLAEAARDMPRELVIRSGAAPPQDARFASALSLAPAGLPWSVWAEPRDPAAPGRDNQGRHKLLLAILFLVAGVLVFGSFTTVRLVRRELRIARLQSDFTATVSHEFRSPLTGIHQLAEMLLAGRAAGDEASRW